MCLPLNKTLGKNWATKADPTESGEIRTGRMGCRDRV